MPRLFFCLLFLIGCRPHPTSTDSSQQSETRYAQLAEEVNLAAWMSEADFQEVKIDRDASLKKTVTYQGVRFEHLLEKIYGPQLTEDIKHQYAAELICKDGYMPRMDLHKAWQRSGFVVDGIAGEADKWPEELKEAYEPLYLVWKSEGDSVKVPWPYGLVSMRLVDLDEEKRYLYPEKNTAAFTGLQTYKQYCIKCHTINGVGGAMGPELNYPRNILEYWQEDSLVSFIRNPQSFRYNCKMPAMSHLSDESMDQILTYLHYISAHQTLAE